jgi:hypothetical protein
MAGRALPAAAAATVAPQWVETAAKGPMPARAAPEAPEERAALGAAVNRRRSQMKTRSPKANCSKPGMKRSLAGEVMGAKAAQGPGAVTAAPEEKPLARPTSRRTCLAALAAWEEGVQKETRRSAKSHPVEWRARAGPLARIA